MVMYRIAAWLLVPNKCWRACDMRRDAGHFFHHIAVLTGYISAFIWHNAFRGIHFPAI